MPVYAAPFSRSMPGIPQNGLRATVRAAHPMFPAAPPMEGLTSIRAVVFQISRSGMDRSAAHNRTSNKADV